ncbi:GIY-YIG nuclease family protein [Candidatus Bathyarchaeota archaeon]|nr:GIY-YIG nuclease family protein [Candidatus Bathyarchaeota archaeon]
MKGIYVLVIAIRKNITVKIGALGAISFRKGFYAYVGSAQNNLAKRLNRHFRKDAKRIRWHIDYLLAKDAVSIVKIFSKEAGKTEECLTAQRLSEFGFPIKGFGCSDCDCQSHLLLLNDYGLLEKTCVELGFVNFHLASESLH